MTGETVTPPHEGVTSGERSSTRFRVSRGVEHVEFMRESGYFPGCRVRLKNALGPRLIDLTNGLGESTLCFLRILGLDRFPEFFHTGFDQGPDMDVAFMVFCVLAYAFEC